MAKKVLNERCPLQAECERNTCEYARKELECPYYSANAREGYYIYDQEAIRDRRDREAMDEASTKKVLCMLTCLPNGVQVMSADIAGLVQTSLNLGILATEGAEVQASFCLRSSVESQKEMLKARLGCLMEQLGGSVEFFGEYSGWEYLADSPLRERMVEVFTEQYGKAPQIEAIHAGVECGIFSGKLPGLDCVSCGPDLLEIHTPRERMSISSVQRVWAFVLEVLRRSK